MASRGARPRAGSAWPTSAGPRSTSVAATNAVRKVSIRSRSRSWSSSMDALPVTPRCAPRCRNPTTIRLWQRPKSFRPVCPKIASPLAPALLARIGPARIGACASVPARTRSFRRGGLALSHLSEAARRQYVSGARVAAHAPRFRVRALPTARVPTMGGPVVLRGVSALRRTCSAAFGQWAPLERSRVNVQRRVAAAARASRCQRARRKRFALC